MYVRKTYSIIHSCSSYGKFETSTEHDVDQRIDGIQLIVPSKMILTLDSSSSNASSSASATLNEFFI